MKKIIFLFIALLGVCFVYGQDITDAVRYSNDEVKGTARFRAMGGAFGALGGDLSAVNINPASSAVFTQSRASFTTGFNSISNNSEYFGSSLSDTDSNINFYQGGGVFVYASNNQNTKWNKWMNNPIISHLPDTNFWHYALQLNIYKYILEKNYNKHIGKMVLVCLHPNNLNNSYQLFEVPNLQNEICSLFNIL